MEGLVKPRSEHETLFSKTVKAGKRVYYVDVKKDRRNELFLSITESKRIHSDDADGHPIYEKHKVFLYPEDIAKFRDAFAAATAYVDSHAGTYNVEDDYFSDGQVPMDFNKLNTDDENNFQHKPNSDFRLDIDF